MAYTYVCTFFLYTSTPHHMLVLANIQLKHIDETKRNESKRNETFCFIVYLTISNSSNNRKFSWKKSRLLLPLLNSATFSSVLFCLLLLLLFCDDDDNIFFFFCLFFYLFCVVFFLFYFVMFSKRGWKAHGKFGKLGVNENVSFDSYG